MELETHADSTLGYLVSAVLSITFLYILHTLREKSLSDAERKLREFNGPPALPIIGTEYVNIYLLSGGFAGKLYSTIRTILTKVLQLYYKIVLLYMGSK
jgi:hypothetical protein